MYRDVVARGSIRGQRWFHKDVGVDVLLCHELFVGMELAGHLEYMLPLVILCFSGFAEGNKGAIGA